MKIEITFGLDPGQTGGGIGWICGTEYGYEEMPNSGDPVRDVAAIAGSIERTLELWPDHARRVGVAVEEIGPRPTDGKRSLFGFARNFGRLEGVAACLDWLEVDSKVVLLSPGAWQIPLGLWGGHATPAAKKLAHKRTAANIFPDIEVNDAGADALLIALIGATRFRNCSLADACPWHKRA